jgi:hypothetical protein
LIRALASDVLKRVAAGKSNKVVAAELAIALQRGVLEV